MSALLLLVGLAAAECDVESAVGDVREHGKKEAYDCLIGSEAGADAALAALADNPADTRVSRALALWMLQRADTPFLPAHVAALNADDKRLLADGVRARRGRKSPVPQHETVFQQFDWYQPVATFTDGRLRPGDKEQIAILSAKDLNGTVEAAPLPSLPWTQRLAAWFRGDGLAVAAPAGLVLVGVIGAVVWVRRPKPG